MESADVVNNGWIAGGDCISQADVSATIAYSFADMARPKLGLAEKYPSLADYAERMEALEAFSTVTP